MIHTRQLTKIYRRFEKEEGLRGSIKSLFVRKMIAYPAVSDFDFDVEPGEFIGLIGPNGAGKTTLVKMLTGIIAPTSGEINVLGYYPNKLESAYKRQYAVVMGQKSQLFFELTPMDTFALFQQLYDIPDADYKRNLDYFIDLFQVSSFLNVQVRTLSLGERMKMELITALLHNPCILYLDEPTIGLDAVAQGQIRTFLREVNRDKGTTILLTSHYMDDIRKLCQRCVVINHGHKLYDGDMETLFSRYQTHKKISVTFASETQYAAPLPVEVLEQNTYHYMCMALRDDVQVLVRDIMSKGDVSDIGIEEEDIGNVVTRIYNETGGTSHA